MKLTTSVDVTFNDGITGTKTGKVTGVLINVGWINNLDTGVFDTIGANYAYFRDDGTQIAQDAFTIVGEEVENLYQAIKSEVPTEGDHKTIEMTKFYLAFRYQMAATFGINKDQINLH